MLAKETVQARLETGISYTEFSYMILQSIDWLKLYREDHVKIQFGGSDQWGNITSGLELIRKQVGDENEAVGMASPLLLKSDGTKFGKSESGALWLDAELTSPYELYQYFINTADTDVENYLKMLTLFEPSTITELVNASKEAPEQRIAQKALAESVTALVHGKEALKEVLNVTESLFQGTFGKLSPKELVMASKSLDTIEVSHEIGILNALSQTNLASSNREARQFVTSGAVMVNDEKITDINYIIGKEKAYYGQYVILRRGKKKYSFIKFL